ncbi:RNA-directed DNA polymerase from mobile element jockey-like, partial [Tachysurus ichikawai]
MDPWLNDTTRALRHWCRQAERKWKKDRLQVSLEMFRDSLAAYQRALKEAKGQYLSALINNNSHRPGILFSTINSVINPVSVALNDVSVNICNAFKQHFLDKVLSVRQTITRVPAVAMSKLMEKLVFAQLQSHLQLHGIGDTFQSGFRSRHSTESALLRVHNDILGALDGKSSVVLVLLDLTAAFDTVDHAILISRLQHVVGLQGAVLNWFSSYLTNRTFSVMLNNYSSSVALLSSGVPQGSILGPTLFSLCMLPLGQLISNHDIQFNFYADDLQIYLPVILSNRSALDPLHNCLQDIKQWLSQNFLHLNEEKIEYILFSPDSPSSSLSFGPLTPQFAPTVRNLVVIFESIRVCTLISRSVQ